MRPRFAIALALTLCAVSSTTAQRVHGRLPAAMAYETGMRIALGADANPALLTSLSDSSSTTIGAAYIWRDNADEWCQTGTSWRGWNAEGKTYIRIGPTVATDCAASYSKGERRNVAFSENADYHIVAPMAMADTAGGDKDSDTYAFAAGFGWDGRRASVGLAIDFSSESEYRDKDPRPKADAVEANVRIGGSLRLAEERSVGLYGSLRKYSQDLSIKFLNVYQAVMTLYHLQGLGSDYTRFAGVYDEAWYRGRGFGFGAEYVGPVFAHVEVRQFKLEKGLDDLENAVIGETMRRRADLSVGRRVAMGSAWCGIVVASVNASKTELSQHVYDDGLHNYHLISKRKPYNATTVEANATFSALRNADASGLFLFGHLTYAMTEEKNNDSKENMTENTLRIKLGGETWRDWRKCRLTGGLTATSRIALPDETVMTTVRNTEMPNLKEALKADHDRRTTSRTGGEVSLRLDIDIPRNLRTVYLLARGSSEWYHGGEYSPIGSFTISAGLTL